MKFGCGPAAVTGELVQKSLSHRDGKARAQKASIRKPEDLPGEMEMLYLAVFFVARKRMKYTRVAILKSFCLEDFLFAAKNRIKTEV